jgi:hypothetical protein
VPHRVVRATLAACAALATCAALAACGTPPELRPKPGSPVPRPSVIPSASAVTDLPSGVVLMPGETAPASPLPSFDEAYAIPCAGYPSAEQVVALVRRKGGLLPRTGAVPVAKGPLCAGTWQYTVFAVPGQEQLQVVSSGTPRDLTMVTAGTDICSARVRAGAPVGIRNAALCDPPGT